MWDFLRDINRHGTTIILTTHYLEEAESLCRNIAIIDKGGIIERDQMSSLLRRLNTQTFVLNTRSPLLETPAISQFNVRRIDEQTLEADIAKEQNLNELFAELSRLGVEVLSMRNKVNRLEEIFMRLVENRTGNV
jgi:ABC-2 type transport system ATP-binding protein